MRKILSVVLSLTFFALLAVQSVLANENFDKNITIGEVREDYQKMFLRESAVLLKKGNKRIDFRFGYQRKQNHLFLSSYDINRKLSLDTTLNYGLFKNTEIFVNFRALWAENTLRVDNQDYRNSEFGIGDISAGCKFLLHTENNFPEIIGSVSLNFPTGKNPYTNNVGLGNGHYVVLTSLTVIKSVDPAILFGGFSFIYPFEKEYDNSNIRPGWSIGYIFGLGLAFNDKLTLIGSFTGSYRDETSGNHPKTSNTSSEPMSFQLGFTYLFSHVFTIEPTIAFGLNNDTPDTNVGFSFSWQF